VDPVGASLVDEAVDEDGVGELVASDVLVGAGVELDDVAAAASAPASREASSSVSAKLAQPPSSAIATSATTGPRFLTIEKARRENGPRTPSGGRTHPYGCCGIGRPDDAGEHARHVSSGDLVLCFPL